MKKFTISLLTVLAVMTAGAMSGAVHADESTTLLPPAKQVEAGVAPEDVTCEGEKVLLLRTDGSPNCLNPASVERFVSLGIATIVEKEDMDMTMEDETVEEADEMEMEGMQKPELVVSMLAFNDRFAAMDDAAMSVVNADVELYKEHGEALLEMVNARAETYVPGDPHIFIIDFDELVLVANGAETENIGWDEAPILESGGWSVASIKAALESEGSIWLMYMFPDHETGVEKASRSYFVLHDGLMFGSGYLLSDLERDMMAAMWVANSAAELYDEHGADAFGMITDQDVTYIGGADSSEHSAELLGMMTVEAAGYATTDLYPFVLDIDTSTVVAHGADPDHIGATSVALTESNKDAGRIVAESEMNGGTWITYEFTNFETGEIETKLSWVTIRDGYLFGSGLYPDEFQTKKINAIMSTDNALAMYAESGQDAFVEITALNVEDEWYPFVMDSETLTEVADGSILDRTGQKIWEQYQMSAAVRDSWDAFDAGQGVFGKYVFLNPETGEQQAKKAWFIKHDGYIFGAGIYLTGEYADKTEVKWSVGTAVEMYKALGMDATFAAVDAMSTDYPSYPFVLDGALDIVSHGSNTDIIGQNLFDVTSPDKDAEQIMEELQGDGDKSWMAYTFLNPETGEDAKKVTLLEMHDGYIFGAGYYVESAAGVSFDDAEQAWLEDNQVITVAYDPAWPPYEYADDEGNLAGVSGTIASMLEDMTGSQFAEAEPAITSWNDALDRMKDGTADVLFVVENTAERDEYMDFTEPWITIPISIITLGDNADAITSENLADYNVVTVDGYAVETWLDESMPTVEYESAASAEDALKMISDGSADAFLDVWGVASHIAANSGIENLAEAGTIADEYSLSIGYTQGDDTLGSILQKALDAIPPGEIERIVSEAVAEGTG